MATRDRQNAPVFQALRRQSVRERSDGSQGTVPLILSVGTSYPVATSRTVTVRGANPWRCRGESASRDLCAEVWPGGGANAWLGAEESAGWSPATRVDGGGRFEVLDMAASTSTPSSSRPSSASGARGRTAKGDDCERAREAKESRSSGPTGFTSHARARLDARLERLPRPQGSHV